MDHRLETAEVITCHFGHVFVVLPDHPKDHGVFCCPHCMMKSFQLMDLLDGVKDV